MPTGDLKQWPFESLVIHDFVTEFDAISAKAKTELDVIAIAQAKLETQATTAGMMTGGRKWSAAFNIATQRWVVSVEGLVSRDIKPHAQQLKQEITRDTSPKTSRNPGLNLIKTELNKPSIKRLP